jgi:hypothetical protein
MSRELAAFYCPNPACGARCWPGESSCSHCGEPLEVLFVDEIDGGA